MAQIFDITFTEKSQMETIELISNMLKIEDNSLTKHIITANPEIIMYSRKSDDFKRIMKNADLITPDGIGVVIAGKLFKENLSERVTGYDTVVGLFDSFEREKKRLKVFMLGAAPDTVKLAVQNIESAYDYIKVVGYHDGYFKEDEENKILSEINNSQAELLLVALGFPKQEEFIYKNKAKIDAKVAIGVGGTFDVLSGKAKRAPKIFQKLHLEWFYRLAKQPKRIFRQAALFKFAFIVLAKKVTGKY